MTSEQFISELTETQGIDFRGEGLPEGAIVHQEQAMGGQAGAVGTWRKSPSKVRMGGQPLPERVWLYNVMTHDESYVPPTIAYKRMSDYPGRYTMKKPTDWDTKQRVPIDETCVVCTKRRQQEGGGGPKKFYDELDLEAHYESFHPREWRRIQREIERQEQREQQGETNKLIAAIAALFQQGQDKEVSPVFKEQVIGGRRSPFRTAVVPKEQVGDE